MLPKINRASCYLIQEIVKLTTDEIKELIKYEHPDGTFSKLEHQLFASYGRLAPNVRPEELKVAVARIGARNALNLEKLRREKEFIEILKNPESYGKESSQKTDSDKESAVIGSTDSTSQNQSFANVKARSGGSQSYQEKDMEREGDSSDEETYKSLMAQPKRSGEAKDGNISELEKDGKTEWQMEAVKHENPPVDTQLRLQNKDGVEELPLDAITINSSRTYGIDLRANSTNTGRDIRSRKGILQVTKTFTRAEALHNLQKIQSIDGRAKIIQQFACLFKGDGTNFLCQ